ncbi:MAG: iron-containing alcohol dehydrogenase [Oscillospiraceae bacterium]|nr:iron-containing alcohol dehydrogenase [Oscillospiraceae bacterium]
MNILNKVFCRTFQFAFRLAMPFLPYREPERYASIEELAKPLQQKRIRSVLLVTDAFLKDSGATEKLENMLYAVGIHCAVYAEVRPNPTVENVEAALKLYHAEGCQCLIAFGGGSAMDCAKAVGARVAYPKKSLNQMKGILRVWRKLPTLIAIPTTAGTGSEVTVTAVITDAATHHKYTMNNFTFIPRYAVHDPAVTYSLPSHLTATTGMDALTHAVEAYIGRSTTKQTRALAKETVRVVFENIETAYKNGSDRTARANMLRAAYAAGVAFSKSYVGYIHAVAHSLGGQYNIPHGLANSVLMPYVLESYGKSVHKKLYELALVAGVATGEDTPMTGAMKFIHAIRELNAAMGIPEKLSGIQKADIPAMAKHAHHEANPLYPVPRLMDAKELEQFYYTVADWSETNEY